MGADFCYAGFGVNQFAIKQVAINEFAVKGCSETDFGFGDCIRHLLCGCRCSQLACYLITTAGLEVVKKKKPPTLENA